MPGRSTGERLRRRGLALEYATLGWNLVGVAVLAVSALAARSVALAGFGLDSLIEIGASIVVVWQLRRLADERRERRVLRLIGVAFLALAVYLSAQALYALAAQAHPARSLLGIVWTALTVLAMAGLAAAKTRTGRSLENPVLLAEGRVTLVDALLAAAVLVGLVLDAGLGWWWADPLAGLVIVGYGLREGLGALRGDG